MNLTVDIPESLYPHVLRVIADILERADRQPVSPSVAPADQRTEASWQIDGLLPNAWTVDFQLLSRLYAAVTPQARGLIDELLATGHTGVHQDDLVAALGLKGTSALAGTVGHITKTAEALGRPSPIHRDANRKTYGIAGNLAEPLRQARLWACPEILTLETWSIDEPPRSYVHLFELHGKTYRHVSEHPKRYLMLPRTHKADELQPAFFKTTDALMETFGEAFDAVEMLVLEFVPDHEADVLRGYPTLEPGQLGEPPMFGDARPDDDLKEFPEGFDVEKLS